MRKTIKNVMMVVPVLITSCHVSLKWKMGPEAAHTMMIRTAIPKARGWPSIFDIPLANRENTEVNGLYVILLSLWATVIGSSSASHSLVTRCLRPKVLHHCECTWMDPQKRVFSQVGNRLI